MKSASKVLAAVCSILASPQASAQTSGPALQSPIGQKGVSSTTSAMQTTLVWPAGSTGNYLDFDWRVDSEPNYDFLKVFIDGSLTYQWSGLGLGGHVQQTMTAGSHVVRFEYAKDSSVDRGRDTAWVDNIQTTSAGKILALHHFDTRSPRMASFVPSGSSGGFTRNTGSLRMALERPMGQAFAGYAAASTSRVERQLTWPAGSNPTLSFTYLVDSEPNYDFLRVYVDGVVAWSASGLKSGDATINLASTGSHTIAFEYAKDTSVDVGRDTAQIFGVSAAVANATFMAEPFDGLNLNTVPDGWAPSGHSGGWRTTDRLPAVVYISKGSTAAEPVLNGVIENSISGVEYTSATLLVAGDVGSASGPAANIYLRESDASSSLFIGGRFKSASVATGSEDGELVILLDANRPDTLLGLGCAAPGSEDRRITIRYASSAGAQPTVTSVSHEKGTCQGPWVPTTAGEEWTTTAVVSEPVGDPGFVHVEIKLVLKPSSASSSQVLADAKLGFAMTHRNLSGLLSKEDVPTVDGWLVPNDRPRVWVTLDMTDGLWDQAYGPVVARPQGDDALRQFFGAP